MLIKYYFYFVTRLTRQWLKDIYKQNHRLKLKSKSELKATKTSAKQQIPVPIKTSKT